MAFMGTDDNGLPKKAYKDTDRKYHVSGQLQAAPKQAFLLVAREAAGLVGAAGEATVMLLGPLPRYVTDRCCDDQSHITNLGTEDMETELQRAEDNAAAAVGSALSGDNVHLFVYHDLFGSDKDLTDMYTADGNSIWRPDDPVHLTSAAYEELGAAMIMACRRPTQPVPRERLESVVPGNPARAPRGAVRPTPWVVGQSGPSMPTSRRGGKGGWPSFRGRFRGRGNRGGPRRGGGGRRWYSPY